MHFKVSTDRLVKLTIKSRAFAAGKLTSMSQDQKMEMDAALNYERDTVQTAIM